MNPRRFRDGTALMIVPMLCGGLGIVLVAGCSSESSAPSNASDVDSSTVSPGSDSGAEAAPGSDAGSDATAVPSRTKAGESCEKADLPAAGAACTIPGTYDVTESLCASADATCTDVTTATPFTWAADVTVTGSEVKLTNGNNRLLKCTLTPPCTCVSSSGSELRFTATGFVRLSADTCTGGGTQNVLTKGVKR